MFDKLKQLKELKSLQDDLKKESYDIEKNGVRLVMNGGMELEEIRLNPQLSQEQQEQAIMQAYNELIRKVQMAMAQKFRGMM
ncbi:MAG TPA: YbaB/EbfC family nucleoid-associated protein [Candidatus Paceibacterota bacterium]|nr:YbaB/EbfC family nucleoid-associated protein [Candidatus Paceibacterota bacterium]